MTKEVDCVATIHDEFKAEDPPVRRFSGEELEDLSGRTSVTSSLCGLRRKSMTQLGGEASTFSSRKLRSAPEPHPFLHTEDSFNPKADRGRIKQIMFGTINGLAMNVATQVALSLVLSRTSAIMMDCLQTVEFETLNVPATYEANQAL